MQKTDEKVRFSQTVALPIAESILEALQPHCDKIEIVGSLRRGRADVGDIELLCVPKKQIVADGFFNSHSENHEGFIQVVDSFEKAKGDARTGKYMQRIHPSGIKVDFFTGNFDSWGWQMIVRTGSADFSHRMAKRLNERGMSSHEFNIYTKLQPQRIACRTEEDFFKLVGLPFIHPVGRV